MNNKFRYRIVVEVETKRDLTKMLLTRDHLPNHVWETTKAIDAIVDATSGFTHDICSDAGIELEDWSYHYQPILLKEDDVNDKSSEDIYILRGEIK